MFRPEPTDILLIVVVALLLFGPNRIPEIARAFGASMREFRDGIAGKEGKTDQKSPYDDSGKS